MPHLWFLEPSLPGLGRRRHAPLCADNSTATQRHDNEPGNVGCGLRPWREYNGDLEAFGRDFRNYFDKLPAEQRVWAVCSIYEFCSTTYQLLLVSIRSGISHHRSTAPNGHKRARLGHVHGRDLEYTAVGNRASAYVRTDLANHESDCLVMEGFINSTPKRIVPWSGVIEACQYAANRKTAERLPVITDRSFTGAKPADSSR